MASNVKLYRSTGSIFEELKVASDWSIISSKPSTFPPTSHSHEELEIFDIRDTGSGNSFIINPKDLPSRTMQPYFAQVSNAGSSWRSLINVKGWNGDNYASWQLIGPAGTTADEDLYFRSGNNTTWNTPRKIYHSGNLAAISQSQIDSGTSSTARIVSPKILRDNFLHLSGGTLSGKLSIDYTYPDFALELKHSSSNSVQLRNSGGKLHVANNGAAVGNSQAVATENYVTSRGYITTSALTDFATMQWVEGKGYITGGTASNNFAAKSHTHPVADITGLGSLATKNSISYGDISGTKPPSNAQKNSDITKAEIEARLTGDITTHTHSQYASVNDSNQWFGQQTFREDIELLKGTALYRLLSPETGTGNIMLPTNKSGTLALLSDNFKIVYHHKGSQGASGSSIGFNIPDTDGLGRAKLIIINVFTSDGRQYASEIAPILYGEGTTYSNRVFNFGGAGSVEYHMLYNSGLTESAEGAIICSAGAVIRQLEVILLG